ncbi:unnamed protein product [Eruca vesicaria subsp. sativa]|uniref:Ubiquitin-like protease family profile domain-containing protein n=1 Tax=Eruca vesicaria subsp. sativa TaxID=29727 RepID=A0ABC8L3H2_ERUVS|nr:unnamed protein product [Eruca vesicaria subsp. sativa]
MFFKHLSSPLRRFMSWSRKFGILLMADGYQNVRSGDCGPVAMKFMELAATGVEEPDVEDLTDLLVDIMRKQYAMDVYKEWIVPLYMGGGH